MTALSVVMVGQYDVQQQMLALTNLQSQLATMQASVSPDGMHAWDDDESMGACVDGGRP